MDDITLLNELEIGSGVKSSLMEGVKLRDDVKIGVDDERFDETSPGQDSNDSNLSYEGLEQPLFQGSERKSGELKALVKGLELEHDFDKEESDLTIELAPGEYGEEDEVNSNASDWESQLCVPQDNLFDVFGVYPSFFDNRIPSTEMILPDNRIPSTEMILPDYRIPSIEMVLPSSSGEFNFRPKIRDNLDFKVYKQRRSSTLTIRKRIYGGIFGGAEDFGRENDIYSVKKRQCSHCKAEKTPQWREGPMGPKTLCNACGVRYKKGRLVAEYRPLASPTFDPRKHSNRDRKIIKRMINPCVVN